MASITSIHLPSVDIVRFYGLTKVCTVLTAANLRSLFHGRKFLKLLKRRTVDQAVPEIPLSIGSKLELLLSLPNFRILPRILTHLSAYAYCTLVPSLEYVIHVYIHVARQLFSSIVVTDGSDMYAVWPPWIYTHGITTHVYAHNNYDDIVTSLTPQEVLTCRHSEE